jgi:CheY-like chemotaxis protein
MSSKFGLFSIRERMAALGGWLDLQSAPGKGTTATLVLPLKTVDSSELKVLSAELSDQVRNSEPRTQNSKLHQQDPKHIRVLLVDDHAMVRQGLRSVLDSYPDIEVVGEAWNGEEAVAMVERLHPSLIVMDINMPKMNGIEATRLIKQSNPETIVICISVKADAVNERRSLRPAPRSCLRKRRRWTSCMRRSSRHCPTSIEGTVQIFIAPQGERVASLVFLLLVRQKE